MPRKPLPATERRSERIELRVSPSELHAIAERAKLEGLTVADYMIRSAIGKRSRRKPRRPRTPKPMS